MGDTWKETSLSHWLTGAWAEGFARVVSALCPQEDAQPLSLTATEPATELWEQWEEPIWLDLESNVSDGAVLRVGCIGATTSAIARHLDIDPEADPADAIQTYFEVLNQTAASVAGVGAGKLGRTIEFQPTSHTRAPRNGPEGVEFRFDLEGVTHSLAIVPNGSMIAALGGPEIPNVPEPGPSSELDEAAPEDPEAGLPRSLALLTQVELDVAVSFGATVMPLESVLQLGTGSIVELQCSASDPVDLLVNNSVIARGEVVVVDGNYGVRVTEIMSARERIAKVL